MQSVNLLIKRSLKTIASAARFYRRPPRNSVTILGYHRVSADIADAERNSIYGLVVSTETFRRHCRILRENFDVVSLETAAECLKTGAVSPRPKAVITFDDGYLDNYEQAYPILREFDLPATIFLPTALIGTNEILAHDKAFWLAKNALERNVPLEDLFAAGTNGKNARSAVATDVLSLTERIVYLPTPQREKIIAALEARLGIEKYPAQYNLLNWEKVREMRANGIDFGNHTATHPVLPLENEAAFESEIFESKKVLERELGAPVTSFAYPNGEYDADVRRRIINAGYAIAVTTKKRLNKRGADLFALGRTCLCEESTRGIGGKFSPHIAELRFGIGSHSKAAAFFTRQPLEKLWLVSALLRDVSFLL